MIKKMRLKLFKILFPKEAESLKQALDISYTYYSKSPSYEKREVGRDIWSRIIKNLND